MVGKADVGLREGVAHDFGDGQDVTAALGFNDGTADSGDDGQDAGIDDGFGVHAELGVDD